MSDNLIEFSPLVGIPENLEPNLRRIVAPNPSPMTFRGTNTYLIGQKDIAVIDPGPNSSSHLYSILNSLKSTQQICYILVSHTHLDHSPLAKPLSDKCGVPILAFGDANAGRSPIMRSLSKTGLVDGGEGVDIMFMPDHFLKHGEIIKTSEWKLEVIHTPGHIGNHISLAWDNACFTADHVMGWASSLISPPDGDLTDFMSSCQLLLSRRWRVFYPGHGAPIHQPNDRLKWLIKHRKNRETSILVALESGPATVKSLVTQIYTDTPRALREAAERNVLAHLISLYEHNKIIATKPLCAQSKFSLM
ncbi:MAG: MBL fold metallo-hydrolase [Aestuariivita sp.]|nr:MBL fold metallo-hydrolase [Aestuariivita sp.]